MLADVVYNLGHFHEAVEHCQEGIALDRERAELDSAYAGSDDPGIMCRVWGSWALSRLGHQRRAQDMADEALRLGLHHKSALIRVEAPMYAAAFHGQNRLFDRAHEINDQALALAQEYDFRVGLALSDMRLGWLRACHGEAPGLAQIQTGIEEWRAAGSTVAAPAFMGLLAEGCIGVGDRETGLAAVEEGFAHTRATRSAHNDAELHRMHGDLLALEDSAAAREAAERAYQRAIDTAREQSAKAWELRAALSLGNLLRGDGRDTEARAAVSEVYDWFEDGSATPDLRDARALLEALAERG